MDRRKVIQTGLASSVALIGLSSCNPTKSNKSPELQGNVNHSACRWCYQDISIEHLAEEGKSLGLKSIELLNLDEITKVQAKGLTCAIANGSDLGITKGWNNVAYHDQLIQDYTQLIPKLADLGIDQVICFSGNRIDLSDEDGIENCAVGLSKILPLAQKHNIKIVMELLNSKVDHKDYQCDHTAWGVALVDKIGSEYFKLLYDIYHMQIMEGNVIDTITKNSQYIAHYHTGGVPGRNEINDTQELNYKAIIKSIVDTGFKGYIAQEFIPLAPNAIASLGEGINICDV